MMRVTDYDSISSQYDRRYQGQKYPGTEQTLFAFIGDNRSVDVLEVGCGTGHWLKVLRDRAGFVTGIDLSANMLQRAQDMMPHAPLVRGRAELLPYRAQSFDRVFCINAFHHFAEKLNFLHRGSPGPSPLRRANDCRSRSSCRTRSLVDL